MKALLSNTKGPVRELDLDAENLPLVIGFDGDFYTRVGISDSRAYYSANGQKFGRQTEGDLKHEG